eukprot:2024692-Amphidinium_carterae.1
MGASPSPAEECTAEQLSAVAALLRDGDQAFVDFSLFTPFNRRLQRATGLQLTGEGTFRKVELKGHVDVLSWMDSFKLLRIALVSLDAVRLARMDRYSVHILHLSRLYGGQFWGVIYAADVRMRQEHFERLRRRGEAA